MSKRALILGIGGQDGSYLAELLLQKGYGVHGLHRRSSVDNLHRIAAIRDKVKLYQGDITDAVSLGHAFCEADPNEVYNMADQDDARWSWEMPCYSWDVTSKGVLNVLEAVKAGHGIRLFQPVSALMFGNQKGPQDENTPIEPRSPYACAKAAAMHLCRCYRTERNVWVSIGIMFNHDSPARSEAYVVHKVCKTAVAIARGKQDELRMGGLEQRFDVGFAGEYVDAAWRMLQQKEPDDFVVGTGVAFSVQDIVLESFVAAGLRIHDVHSIVKIDHKLCRPLTTELVANPVKAERVLGWRAKVRMPELVRMIVKHYREQL